MGADILNLIKFREVSRYVKLGQCKMVASTYFLVPFLIVFLIFCFILF